MQRHLEKPQGVSVLAEILLHHWGAQAQSQPQDVFNTPRQGLDLWGAEGWFWCSSLSSFNEKEQFKQQFCFAALFFCLLQHKWPLRSRQSPKGGCWPWLDSCCSTRMDVGAMQGEGLAPPAFPEQPPSAQNYLPWWENNATKRQWDHSPLGSPSPSTLVQLHSELRVLLGCFLVWWHHPHHAWGHQTSLSASQDVATWSCTVKWQWISNNPTISKPALAMVQWTCVHTVPCSIIQLFK